MRVYISNQISNPESLAEFLRRIIEGLKYKEKLNEEAKIFLRNDFTSDTNFYQGDDAVFIDPNAKEPRIGPPQILTLKNVLQLLQSSFNTMNSGAFRRHLTGSEYQNNEFYEELQDAYLNYIDKDKSMIQQSTGSVEDRQKALTKIAEKLLVVLETLNVKENEEEVEAAFTRSAVMPLWLQEINRALLKNHWKPVTEVISLEGEDGFLDKALNEFKDITDEAKFPGVRLRGDSEVVSLVALRNFLNTWAQEIIQEDQKNPFPNAIKIFDKDEIKNLEFFPSSTTNSVAQDDLEKVQSLDFDALKSFKKILLKSLKEAEGKVPSNTIPDVIPGEDGDGGDEENSNKEPIPETVEEKEKLRDEILQQQHYVQEETLRVKVIARNFVLAFNNFPQDIPTDLADSEAFRYLDREITDEILELLNRDPHALDDPNRRAIVIRSFLFRLMANPRFQTYLALLKDKYAAIQAKEIPDLNADQVVEFKKQFVENLDKARGGNVDELLQDIYAKLKVDALPDLSDAQKKVLTAQLKARLSRNQTANVDLFLAEANAALRISSMVELSGAEQVSLRQLLVTELLSNPKVDINDLLARSFASLRTSQFPNITSDQEAAVIASVLPKLSRTPLDGLDAILNESYAALVASGIQDLDSAQKSELKNEITLSLKRDPRANLDNILQKFAQRIPAGKGAPSVSFDLKNLSKGHFASLLNYYNFTAEEQLAIFDGADLLMFMRISPDRVSRFKTDEVEKILGVSFGKLDGKQQTDLIEILSAYLVLRRQWFEKEYNVNSVSQSQDASLEGKALSREELELILAKKELFKKSGLDARHFVRAAVLTPTQLRSFESTGKVDIEETGKAADILAQERKEIYANIIQQLAISDAEMAESLARETGISIRADRALTESQKSTLFLYLESSVDLSPFELESGVVVNQVGNVIRNEGQAQSAYQAGNQIKPGITSLKALSSEGAALLGSAAANALLPGVGFLIPKAAKEKFGKVIAVGGAVGGAVVAGSGVLAAAELVTQLGGLGGGVGTIIGAAGGPLGGIISAAGANNGVLNGILSGGTGFGTTAGAGSTQAGSLQIPGLLSRTASSGNLFSKFASGLKNIVTTPAGASVAGFVGIATIGTAIVFNTYSVAFIPPDIVAQQVVAQNKYVIVTKTADPSTATNPTPGSPKQISYSINITAKTGYKVEITNISDTYTVATKDKSTPTVSDSTDFSQYKTTLESTGTGKVTIPYNVSFDEKFKDSLVTNNIQITFNTTGAGAKVSDSTSATAAVCFGDCPKPAAGCWPATGRDGQDPFGAADHGTLGEDAFDISAPKGTPIYAPFSGTVCAKYMEGSKVPVKKPGTDKLSIQWGFGYFLTLKTDDGRDFLFGHLSEFGPGLELDNCGGGGGGGMHVQPGDLIGFIGDSGSSWGTHLHYQLGIFPPKSTPPSVLRSLIPAADKDITVGKPIVSCYDQNGIRSNTGGASFQ